MKKVLLTAALVLAASSAFAGIATSKHDFSATGQAKSYGDATTAGTQICIYCHTPHSAKTSALLWNRNNGTSPVTMYIKGISGTLNLTMLTQVGATSTLCLSCHDGTVSVDSFAGNPNTVSKQISSSARLTGDLTNDHPIGFSYALAANPVDGDIVAQASMTTKLPLFVNGATSDSMECATCHDVHGKIGVQAKFLRVNNAGSNLCLNCHSK